MLAKFKKIIPDTHPIRLLYHKIKAFFAAVLNGFPANKLIVIGITGTNGKTTTTNMIANILMEAGNKVGVASTINFRVGDDYWTNRLKQSTQGPFSLQKLLKRMVKEGCKYAVLEVTSHSLTQSRVWGINFDIGIITNVTDEHIEYHGSFNSYLNAKGKLFKLVSNGKRKTGVQKNLILNIDDKYYSFFNQFVADRKLTYGMSGSTVYAENAQSSPEGSSFTLTVPNNKIEVNLKMPGEFNVYNALAAGACGLALNIPLEKIKAGLESNANITGRFERVEVGQDFNIVVDYAHTPDALENLFEMYKRLTKGRLFVVFGATGGGRDKAKRPVMGEIADRIADFIIATNDDPYQEDEWTILRQIGEGIKRREGDRYWRIIDRKEAIRLALTLAKPDDTVVVAGKGAEETIMLKQGALPWNDKEVIEELLEREVELELN